MRRFILLPVLAVLAACGEEGPVTPSEPALVPLPSMSIVNLDDGIGDATLTSGALVSAENPKGIAYGVEGLNCLWWDFPIECPTFDQNGFYLGGFYYMNRPLNELFGASVNVVHGEVVHVGRGCPDDFPPFGVPGGDAYLADPAGKIALIERGACFFGSKVLRAQLSGAIAVIVYNREFIPGNPQDTGGDLLLQMFSPEEIGFEPSPITIPAMFVGRATGLALAAVPVDVKIQGGSIKAVREAVQTLIDDGVLSKKQASPLKDALGAAADAVEAGDLAAAEASMNAFMSEVYDLLWAGQITEDEFQALFGAWSQITQKLTATDPVIAS